MRITMKRAMMLMTFAILVKRLISCDSIFAWRGAAGEARFPKLISLARDNLAAMASSVASEASFSGSGGFAVADRARFAGKSIAMMMKLRSGNRLLGKLD